MLLYVAYLDVRTGRRTHSLLASNQCRRNTHAVRLRLVVESDMSHFTRLHKDMHVVVFVLVCTPSNTYCMYRFGVKPKRF
jgi:hypothetical protein